MTKVCYLDYETCRLKFLYAQTERCRELPGEVDKRFQDEGWINPLHMTCPDDRA